MNIVYLHSDSLLKSSQIFSTVDLKWNSDLAAKQKHSREALTNFAKTGDLLGLVTLLHPMVWSTIASHTITTLLQ